MSEPVTTFQCGHCDGTIIASDEDRTIAHTVPACSWFERIMKHAGVPGELVLMDQDGKRKTLQ